MNHVSYYPLKLSINIFLGSADAIITLVNGGANVESHDKDGLTGKYENIYC